MKDEHTKGPWEAHTRFGRYFVSVKIPCGNWPFTSIAQNIGGAGSKEANAQLIAASPELLDACQYALGCLQAWQLINTKPNSKIVIDTGVEKIKSAIAKAKGQTSERHS